VTAYSHQQTHEKTVLTEPLHSVHLSQVKDLAGGDAALNAKILMDVFGGAQGGLQHAAAHEKEPCDDDPDFDGDTGQVAVGLTSLPACAR